MNVLSKALFQYIEYKKNITLIIPKEILVPGYNAIVYNKTIKTI